MLILFTCLADIGVTDFEKMPHGKQIFRNKNYENTWGNKEHFMSANVAVYLVK
jgi:hypothetical protein